jgi:hypothetical protein
MMNKTLKKLEKGAVARMRETNKKLRENSISKELEEALKKKEQSKQDAPKKIAGPRQGVDLP